MRFNPPPGWPPPPAGWQPTADWAPDAAWPTPPDGWQLWLPADEETAQPTVASASDRAAPLTAGAALRDGWERLGANALPWLGIGALFYLVVLVGYLIISRLWLSSLFDSLSSGSIGHSLIAPGFSGSVVAVSIIFQLMAFAVITAATRGSLDEYDGSKPTVPEFFRIPNIGNLIALAAAAVLTWLVCSLLGFIPIVGGLLSIVASLAVSYFMLFSMVFLVDRRMTVADAIAGSIELGQRNAEVLVLVWLALVAINVVGALACGLGLIAAVPFSILVITCCYRSLSVNSPYPARSR